ncbi:MAG: bifunctional chorismate mutase/prephenate dehydrogenase [Calothrix sp. C42_A2020_038]|nr:bifunctional chorismate mutase/prephenate dehydrogenase [Calothrix sp. C42_A2020_038]
MVINHLQQHQKPREKSISTPRVNTKNITIIGGHGRMGKFFTNQLVDTGHQVDILEKDWFNAEKLLSEADLVLCSVPIKCTVEVIERAAKFLNPTTALADITSVKAEPVKAMLKYHSGAVIGLHPMFGPSTRSFRGQKVVVCPGRNDEVFDWLLNLMRNQGAELIYSMPEEHDRMMVMIQATRHFCRLTQAVYLAQEQTDIDKSLLMSSPSYRQEIEILKRLLNQNPQLCVDIMLATQERCQAIKSLAETYIRLAELVENQDREALIQEIETTQTFFNQRK